MIIVPGTLLPPGVASDFSSAGWETAGSLGEMVVASMFFSTSMVPHRVMKVHVHEVWEAFVSVLGMGSKALFCFVLLF